MFTESQIAAFLSFTPLITEELWKRSGIHKNSMIRGVKSLIKKNMVFKHKYDGEDIPGDDYTYYLKYRNGKSRGNVKNKRNYLLLNCSHPNVKDMVSFYYRNYSAFVNKKTNRKRSTTIVPESVTKEVKNHLYNIDKLFGKLIEINTAEKKERINQIKASLKSAKDQLISLQRKYGEEKIDQKEPIAITILKSKLRESHENNDVIKYVRISLPIKHFQLNDKQINKLSSQERTEYLHEIVNEIILLKSDFIALNLSFIKDGKKFPIDLSFNKKDNLTQSKFLLQYLNEYSSRFRRPLYSQSDMLIRLAADPIMIDNKMYPTLMSYSELWELVNLKNE